MRDDNKLLLLFTCHFFFLLFSPSLPLSESEFAYAYVFGGFKMERNREYPSTSPTRARERQHSTSTTCPWGVQEWEIRGKLCRDLNNDGRSQGTLGEGILWETRNYLFFSFVFFFFCIKSWIKKHEREREKENSIVVGSEWTGNT